MKHQSKKLSVKDIQKLMADAKKKPINPKKLKPGVGKLIEPKEKRYEGVFTMKAITKKVRYK